MKISDPLIVHADESHIRIEKSKARTLRASQWWKNRLAESVCHYCKGRFAVKDLCMDHVVPISRGGKSRKSNVVPACKKCNNNKKYLLPSEWERA